MSRTASPNSSLIPIAQITLFLVFLLIIWSLGQNLIGLSTMDERLITAKEELSILQQQNQALQEKAAKVASGADEEAVIRDKLGLVKPGETMVIVPEQVLAQALEAEIPQTQLVIEEPKPVWRQWVGVFF